jgi:hypothetical protein
VSLASVSSLDADVAEFFAQRRGAFGAMNLLPDHLPGEERIREIVCNVMTVDYAIGRLHSPLYLDYLGKFAAATAKICGTVGLPDTEKFAYPDHLARLESLDNRALAQLLPIAAADSMETFNLFTPKQCNMSCRGCYAAAVPITTRPYDDDLTNRFYDGAVSIIKQAAGCGARTVYTSGDGEPTTFPRFFDLLAELQRTNMQWLFFTAGLIFSSENSAIRAWADAAKYLQGPSRERIERRLHEFKRDGQPKPTVRAFVAELAEFRENVQIYHSVWSVDGATNTAVRRPIDGDYTYCTVSSRGTDLELPSSLLTMMNEIFTGDMRGRLGLEMPVSDISIGSVPAAAAFVVDNGLRSYFEPTILTGRNKIGDLGEASPERLMEVSRLLVRTLCGFRNVHQPTIKFHQHSSGSRFVASPGMGVDTADLRSMGVLEPLVVGDDADGFFRAVHSSLMTYANYVHITGCKCNDFAAALLRDRAKIAEQWQGISASVDLSQIGVGALVNQLCLSEAPG